jgi:glycosyltransferase involved in cell wall biosynthesis
MKTASRHIYFLNDRFVIGGVATIIMLISSSIRCNDTSSEIWVSEKKQALPATVEINRLGFGLNGCRKFLSLVASFYPRKLIKEIVGKRKTGVEPVIHLNTPYMPTAIAAMVACKLTRTPLVYTVHANRSHIPKLAWVFENIIFPVSGAFIIELRSSVRDYHERSRKSKVRYVPFGIDPKNAEAKWKGSGTGPFTFVAVNRLDPNRMTDVFMRAFAAMPSSAKARMHIHGDGAAKDELLGLAESLGIRDRVELFPSMKEADIQHVLSRADCFLTLTAGGDVGMTGMLAAGVGIPILAYEFDDLDMTGYTGTSVKSLAEKMEVYLSATRVELEAFARKTSDLLYAESNVMVKKYMEIYREIAP